LLQTVDTLVNRSGASQEGRLLLGEPRAGSLQLNAALRTNAFAAINLASPGVCPTQPRLTCHFSSQPGRGANPTTPRSANITPRRCDADAGAISTAPAAVRIAPNAKTAGSGLSWRLFMRPIRVTTSFTGC